MTRHLRASLTLVNLLRFALRERFLGFEYANLLLQRLDKHSVIRILRRYGAEIGRDCDIESGLVFHNCRDYRNLRVGDHCHIGKHCFFDLRSPVRIGDHAVISMRCAFITHMDLGSSRLSSAYPPRTSGIVVGTHAYLGVNATVLLGVEVGASTLVAANALVTENTGSHCMVGGTPARKIKELE